MCCKPRPSLVLYEYKTWSLFSKGEHRVRMSEGRELRRMFRSKSVNVTAVWRILHYEDFHTFYSLLNIVRTIKSRRMQWAGHVESIEEIRNAYLILI
jgi:hypothetical protein